MSKFQLGNLILHTLNASSNKAMLSYGSRHLPCCLGKTGIKSLKREGDGATPRAVLPLQQVYYRGDRLRRPKTFLPTCPLTPSDGWCDDPNDANYNLPVSWPYGSSAEHLWRSDHIYDLIVVLGYNFFPRRKFAGSAIFWHLAKEDFSPTQGCLATRKEDMLKLLEICGPKTRIIIT